MAVETNFHKILPDVYLTAELQCVMVSFPESWPGTKVGLSRIALCKKIKLSAVYLEVACSLQRELSQGAAL